MYVDNRVVNRLIEKGVVSKQEADQAISSVLANLEPLAEVFDDMDVGSNALAFHLEKKPPALPSGRSPEELVLETWKAMRKVDPAYEFPKNLVDGRSSRPVVKVGEAPNGVTTAAINPNAVIFVNSRFVHALSAVNQAADEVEPIELGPKAEAVYDQLKDKYTKAEVASALFILAHEVKHYRNGDLQLMKLRHESKKADPMYEQADNIASDITINTAIRDEWGIPVRGGLTSKKYGIGNSTTGKTLEKILELLKNNPNAGEAAQQLVDDTHNPENYKDTPTPQVSEEEVRKQRDEALKKDRQQNRPGRKHDDRQPREKIKPSEGEITSVDIEHSGLAKAPDWKKIVTRIASKLKNPKQKETYTKVRRSYLPGLELTLKEGGEAVVAPGERLDVLKNKKAIMLAVDTSGSMLHDLPYLYGEMLKLLQSKKIKDLSFFITLFLADRNDIIVGKAIDKQKVRIIYHYNQDKIGKEIPFKSFVAMEAGGTDIPKKFIEFVKMFRPPNIGVILLTDSDIISLVSPGRVKELIKATDKKLAIIVPEEDYVPVKSGLPSEILVGAFATS